MQHATLSPDQVFPIFVINLDRRRDRLKIMADQLDAMDIGWDRIAALDARTVDVAELAPDIDVDGMRHNVQAGAMCLAHTNVSLMRRIVEDGLPGAVILQDDVEVSPDLAHLAKTPDWAPDRFGLIQMEFWHKGSGTKLLEVGEPTALEDRQVHRLHSKALGAACFFVRDHGARAFLERGLPVQASGDHSLFNPAFATAFDAMQTGLLVPALARQKRTTLGTDISGGTPGGPRKRKPLALSPGRLHRKLRKEIPTARRLPREWWLRLTGQASRRPVSVRL